MKKHIEKLVLLAKKTESDVATISMQKRKQIILEIIQQLQTYKNKIFQANEKDISNAKTLDKTAAFIERLTLSEKGFQGMISQLQTIAKTKNILGEIIEKRKLTNGIQLKKIRFPLGTILSIYESRPNVTVDAAAICFASGNVAILKGGSEAQYTNLMLMNCIHNALKKYKVSIAAITYLAHATHSDIAEILTRNDLIDLVIPRGNASLTQTVANISRISILYHSAGGARAYIDKDADISMAIKLVINAKTQRNSVCNALDCILIHKDIADVILPELTKQLKDHHVTIRTDNKAYSIEFLDAIVAIKIVKDENEALNFVKRYSHHHTEILITKDKRLVQRFVQEIDAASLMINCSSRLNDGGEFGMGAEMGIATGKFHARGPVGMRELTTYKWVAFGNGQVKE